MNRNQRAQKQSSLILLWSLILLYVIYDKPIYSHITISNLFYLFYIFVVYVVYQCLIYWKSIIYWETPLWFRMFILFLWKLFLSIYSLLREWDFANSLLSLRGLNWYLRECMREWEFMSLWALLILIYDLNPNLREWVEAKNFFFWIWAWLYILYIRGTAAPSQGPNFPMRKIFQSAKYFMLKIYRAMCLTG